MCDNVNMTLYCKACNLKIARSSKKIACKKCETIYHEHCLKDVSVKPDGSIPICCAPTVNRSRRSNSLSPQSPFRGFSIRPITKFELDAALDSMTKTLQQSFAAMLENSVKDIKSELQGMQAKYSALEVRVSALESAPSPQTSPQVIQDLLKELELRHKFSKNIVVNNFPTNLNPDEDLPKFNNLLNSFLPPIQAISALRFGNSENGKLRSLKISFNSADEALKVLRNKQKFTSQNNILIKNDLTPDQCKYLKALHAMLNERIEKGEPNLTIRYIHNIPQIVEKAPKNE